jgi:hypothetical protein
MSKEYTFPFDTCEKVSPDGVAQPYSTLFNFFNCAIIFYFMVQTKHIYTFLLLLSILSLELIHMFSHAIHIPGSIQTYITHILSYFVVITLLYSLYCYTNILPNLFFTVYLVLLVLYDLYAVVHLSILHYVSSQSLLFVSLLIYYFTYLPKSIQNKIYLIILLVLWIMLLFFNEIHNCNTMMSYYPHFPYHIFIELSGIVLFYIVCSSFYKL